MSHLNKFINTLIIIFTISVSILAQTEGSFNVEIDRDTILLGNSFELTYVVENVEGDFIPPDFLGFQVVSGPNISTQFSMINGKTSRSASYSYVLMPLNEGEYLIPAAGLESNDEIFTSHEVPIVILPNPDGKIQSSKSPRSYKQESQPLQTKKRKSYKL